MPMKSTFGLSPGRLAKLLDVGSVDAAGDSQLSAAEAAAELMRRRLDGPLHLEGCIDSLSTILGRPCPEMEPVKDRPLGDVLLDPGTPLPILETLKHYGKGLAGQWDEGPEHVVAYALYFAAIAAALGSHCCKITSRSHRELADALRVLMDDRWITPELAGLFDTARMLCEAEEL